MNVGAFNDIDNSMEGEFGFMPRSSRESKKSFTGVYHIILRGINSQEIFFDNMDREKFIKEIRNTKEMYNYKLYAYVLMNNHVHMLIQDENDLISKIIQSLATRYAMYFNKKYERIGHLFYNRFHSKCVEDERYLLNVQKYIHKNPQKDGICRMEQYKWSSYQEYIGNHDITDTEFILTILNENREKAIEIWKDYHEEIINSEYNDEIEFEIKQNLTDDEAIYQIKQKLQIDNVLEIQKYSANYRNKIIREIAFIPGMKKEQLARIIGVSKRTIYRAIDEEKNKGVSL